MSPLPLIVNVILIATVVIAAGWDVRSRTIPNWLSLGAIVAGLAVHPILTGWSGLKLSAGGFGLAALIFLPLFILRWLGGGDVKLMAAVGALAGPGNLFIIFIMDTLLGGAVALLAVLFKGRVKKTLGNIGTLLGALGRGKVPSDQNPELEAGNEKSMGLPRAVTIAAATLLVIWATPR